MRQALVAGVSALLMAVLLPEWLLPAEMEPTQEPLVLIIDQPVQEASDPVIRLAYAGQYLDIPLEDYLVGVVLSELPATFETEAWKAQAVAARTFACRQMERGKHGQADLCSDSTCCQAWNSREVLMEKLGESGIACWKKAEQAVKDTAGEVMTYEGELIEAVYFSCSGGRTEDAVAVWGGAVPYLQSVESTGEDGSSVYETQLTVSADQFRRTVQEAFPEANLSGEPPDWFGRIQYTEGGGVDTAVIGGTEIRGTVLRSLFGLRSTNFRIDTAETEITFRVKGYGHRVGMSQYGANAMAKRGHTYREILSHYYTGVEIEKRH